MDQLMSLQVQACLMSLWHGCMAAQEAGLHHNRHLCLV